MITTADFPALTLDLQEIFNEAAKNKMAEAKGMDLFGVKDTERQAYIYQVIHGVSGIREVTPGQDLPKVNSNQGDQSTFTQRYFGAEFDVTKAMRKFDLYNEIEGLPRTLVDDAFDDIDQSMADVLLFGWSTSYTDVYSKVVAAVCPDAKALFSASHDFNVGVRTFSNIITDGTNTNPAMSRAAIVKTRAIGKRYKDAVGKTRPVDLNELITGPTGEDLAERLVFSQQISGNNNNDINALKGKVKKITVWDRLDYDNAGTDKSAYWFLADSGKVADSLHAYFAERPELDAPEQVYENKNWTYTLDYFYTLGLGLPAYVYGAKGDNS
jgi:hypothetical protein